MVFLDNDLVKACQSRIYIYIYNRDLFNSSSFEFGTFVLLKSFKARFQKMQSSYTSLY